MSGHHPHLRDSLPVETPSGDLVSLVPLKVRDVLPVSPNRVHNSHGEGRTQSTDQKGRVTE